MTRPWREDAGGIRIAVRVTPRASKNALLAGTSEYFTARLAAPPVDGAANTALIELIAKTFGVAKRAVALTGGDSSRLKRLTIEGDPPALAGIAAKLYGAAHDG